jgi:hypothetical protein
MVVEYNHVLSANVGEEDFYVPLRPSPLPAGAMSSRTLFGYKEMEVGVYPRGLDTVNRLRQQRSSAGKTGHGCNLMLRASMPGRGGLSMVSTKHMCSGPWSPGRGWAVAPWSPARGWEAASGEGQSPAKDRAASSWSTRDFFFAIFLFWTDKCVLVHLCKFALSGGPVL